MSRGSRRERKSGRNRLSRRSRRQLSRRRRAWARGIHGLFCKIKLLKYMLNELPSKHIRPWRKCVVIANDIIYRGVFAIPSSVQHGGEFTIMRPATLELPHTLERLYNFSALILSKTHAAFEYALANNCESEKEPRLLEFRACKWSFKNEEMFAKPPPVGNVSA